MKEIAYKVSGVVIATVVAIAPSASAFSTACERLLGGSQVVNSGGLLFDALGCLASDAVQFMEIVSGWL